MLLSRLRKIVSRGCCSNTRKVLRRCFKIRHMMLERQFNDSAIISRERKALKPFSDAETNLILTGKADVESILSCRANEELDRNKFVAEDAVFDSFKNKDGLLSVGKFLTALTSTGIRRRDQRLKGMMAQLNAIYKFNQEMGNSDSLFLDKITFRK